MVVPEVGARISCEGFLGTIKYIGEVPPTSGVWWGVEWDETSRGKHDGSHGGVRYFQTSHPTSASFVRPPRCSLGFSLLEAVRQKYVSLEDVTMNEGQLGADQQIIGKLENKEIVFVGISSILKEQRSLDTLKHINLRKCEVSHAGKLTHEEEFGQSIFPSLVELDLSHNLLSNWKEVIDIISHLPALEVINLQGNVFSKEIPSFEHILLKIHELRNSVKYSSEIAQHQIEEEIYFCHQNVKEICLYNLSLDWEKLLCISVLIAPKVKALVASFNFVTSINLDMYAKLYQQLSWRPLIEITFLNLEGNLIESWDEILKLDAVMSSLKTLVLNSCGISKISFDSECLVSEKRCTSMFSQLSSLSLSRNKISCWDSINELNKLQSLRHLSMSLNPIDCGFTEFTNWGHKVVARISGLTHLNRIKIDRLERRGAEIDYLKTCIAELGAAEVSETFLEKHPRYKELIKKFGSIEVVSPEVTTPKMRAGILNVNIALISSDPIRVGKTKEAIIANISQRILKTMTVGKLKMTIKNIFKKDIEKHFGNAKDFALSYSSAAFLNQGHQTDSKLETANDSHVQNVPELGSVLEVPIDDIFKELDYYCICEGDTIYVRCA